MSGFNLYNILRDGLEIEEAARTVSVAPRLKPSDYVKVKNLLNRLGGSWNVSKQVFEFNKSPTDLVSRALSFGSRCINQYHFYPTPQKVFEYMAAHTPLSYFGASKDRIKVLEPSCGEGNLITLLQDFASRENRTFEIDGFDIDPLNALFCQEAGLNVNCCDFLKVPVNPVYDLITLNPPFNGDEFIKHIRHAQMFLKSDGRLISVIPTDWLNDIEKSENRKWLIEQVQADDYSNLYKDNFFEPGVFKGVSIEIAVVSIKSKEATRRRYDNNEYKEGMLEEFRLWRQMSNKTFNYLHHLRIKEPGYTELRKSLDSFISKELKRVGDTRLTLIERFKEDYVNDIILEWFPMFAEMLSPSYNEYQLEIFNYLSADRAA